LPLKLKHVKHIKLDYQILLGIKRHKYLLNNSAAIAEEYLDCRDILKVL
jgi:hypothetical protein